MEDDLRVQGARLEERMNTMQAEYKTDIALLAEQLAERACERRVGEHVFHTQCSSVFNS